MGQKQKVFTIEIYPPGNNGLKKIENVKFLDLIPTIKNFEIKDYPVREDFSHFLRRIKKLKIGKRDYDIIHTSIPRPQKYSWNYIRPIYTVYFTRKE
jgi:hypothetical protein